MCVHTEYYGINPIVLLSHAKFNLPGLERRRWCPVTLYTKANALNVAKRQRLRIGII